MDREILTGPRSAPEAQFGSIDDPEAEVARRMARLHVAPFGVTQRQRPDGHNCGIAAQSASRWGASSPFTPISQSINSPKWHFAVPSPRPKRRTTRNLSSWQSSATKCGTPLNALLNTVRLLEGSALAPPQQALARTARLSGDALLGLIDTILDMSEVEAGTLSINPTLVNLRSLLESSVERCPPHRRPNVA